MMKHVLMSVFVVFSALSAQARNLDSTEIDIANTILHSNALDLPEVNASANLTGGQVSYFQDNVTFPVSVTYTFFGLGQPLVVTGIHVTDMRTLPAVTERSMTDSELRLGFALLRGGKDIPYRYGAVTSSATVEETQEGGSDEVSYNLPLMQQGCSTLGGCATYIEGTLQLTTRKLPGESAPQVIVHYSPAQ